ncbi:hypothetical protein [Aeromicrobium sp.]|uniref:hypothetical protein n=1 Tax=Aeromicrobium sp. TaxID=1871063 RepID=UPI003D6C1622
MTASTKPHFSIGNHIGHGLGMLVSAFLLLVGISPEAREGSGYAGNIWIGFVVFGGIALVALLASWITRAGLARRIGGVALILAAVVQLSILFVPDRGVAGLIGNSAGALLCLVPAVLVLRPSGKRD